MRLATGTCGEDGDRSVTVTNAMSFLPTDLAVLHDYGGRGLGVPTHLTFLGPERKPVEQVTVVVCARPQAA